MQLIDREQIIKLYENGYSIQMISKITGTSRFKINQILKDTNKCLNYFDPFSAKEELEIIIKESVSLREVLTKANLNNKGGASYLKLKKFIKENNINTDHFLGMGHSKTINNLNEYNKITKIPIENILVENSTYQTSKLSKRLREEKLLEYKCSKCSLGNEWNSQPLTLHVDHINGVHNDHRLHNLRFLCPNCHSQTSTYCGRNASKGLSRIKVRRIKKTYLCPKCNGKMADKRSKSCNACQAHQTKANYPPMIELIKMVEELGYVQAGKRLGVSNNAVKKYILKNNKK